MIDTATYFRVPYLGVNLINFSELVYPPQQKIISSLAIVIPTVGRREITEQSLSSLVRRRSVPGQLVVVGAKAEDLPQLEGASPFPIQLVTSPAKGLPIQRNYGVDQLSSSVKLVTFLDDDVELHDDYCAEVENTFLMQPKVVGFSGHVLVNGNVDRAKAREIIDQQAIDRDGVAFTPHSKEWAALYGCTMNVLRSVISVEKFDERLPLYAMGEDVDIGFRLRRHGIVGGAPRCLLVHLHVQVGRISEVGFGYSQVINYIYFTRKKIGFPTRKVYLERLIKLPLINLLCSLFPAFELRKNVDRRGRLRGNILAFRDLARGEVDPMNLLKIKEAVSNKNYN